MPLSRGLFAGRGRFPREIGSNNREYVASLFAERERKFLDIDIDIDIY